MTGVDAAAMAERLRSGPHGSAVRGLVAVWSVAAAVITIAWVIGVLVFATTADAQDATNIRFHWRDQLAPLVWLPVVLLMAWGRARGGTTRSVATIGLFTLMGLLVVTTFGSGWGGFCVSSRDRCVVVPESHVSHLLMPLAVLALGAATEWLFVRRRAARSGSG